MPDAQRQRARSRVRSTETLPRCRTLQALPVMRDRAHRRRGPCRVSSARGTRLGAPVRFNRAEDVVVPKIARAAQGRRRSRTTRRPVEGREPPPSIASPECQRVMPDRSAGGFRNQGQLVSVRAAPARILHACPSSERKDERSLQMDAHPPAGCNAPRPFSSRVGRYELKMPLLASHADVLPMHRAPPCPVGSSSGRRHHRAR